MASIAATLQSLMWALLLLSMMIYVVAIAFTQSATDLETHDGDVTLQEFWGTVPIAMLTLFESISGGVSWHDVVAQLRNTSPLLLGIFMLYIFFTYFAVLNVITAVFCQSAIETVGQDPDLAAQAVMLRKRLYIDKLLGFFESVDKDGSGQITILELEKILSDDNTQAYLAAMGLDVSDAWSVFKLMDVDESMSVDVEEFVNGILRLQGSAKSVDVQTMMDTQKWLTKRLGSMEGYIGETLTQVARGSDNYMPNAQGTSQLQLPNS